MNKTLLSLREVRLPLAQFDLALDLEIRERVIGLFGPSGAGKTSVLDLIAGLRRPAAARIQVGERMLTDTGARIFVPPERRHIGYVPQEGALFPHLNVRRNLLYGCARAKAGSRLHFDAVIDVLEIRPLLDRRSVTPLSGGERQRIALARALLSGPELLLLDEPLAALDAGLKERIVPYLFRVRDEFAVPMLLVTHAPAEVMRLCDSVIILERGRVTAHGAPAEIFEAAPATHYVRRPAS